jgi:carboxypeptidase C (cathepsin A)
MLCQDMTRWFYQTVIGAFSLAILNLHAEDVPSPSTRPVVSNHTLTIEGKEVSYVAEAGFLSIKDSKDVKAEMFYVAYLRKDVQDSSQRPITFCFNGGPGSSAVWLHMGAFGPKKVSCSRDGLPNLPYTTEDNPSSLIDITDLVFIDPVATGYSKAQGNQDKQFFGVKQDIESIAEFIRAFVTEHGRWLSPKILAGESYGTTRAAGLACYLNDNNFMAIDGIVLVSSVLNWQTIDLSDRYSGNDLPSVLALPTYAAAALFHKATVTSKDLPAYMEEVKAFAIGEYATALMKGDRLQPEEKKDVLAKLCAYTGLTSATLECMNLRVDVLSFCKKLLEDKGEIAGRFDARAVGVDTAPCDGFVPYDPSFAMLVPAFTATFNDYLKNVLHVDKREEYKILADVFPWDFDPAINQFLNFAPALSALITKTAKTKVFIASGLYDLATPFFATDYTANHLQLDKRFQGFVQHRLYPGGHMMYLNPANLIALKGDLVTFYGGLVNKKN